MTMRGRCHGADILCLVPSTIGQSFAAYHPAAPGAIAGSPITLPPPNPTPACRRICRTHIDAAGPDETSFIDFIIFGRKNTLCSIKVPAQT